MFMLCYCNGSLARESVRDSLNKSLGVASSDWQHFDETTLSTPVASKSSSDSPSKIGVYFPLPEIIPNVQSGTWRFNYSDGKVRQTEEGWNIPADDVRAILESQALSMRMRSEALLKPEAGVNGGKTQPRRLYVVGGGSKNAAIASVMAGVIGGFEGVYKLDIGGNACALGAAYYATWALERKQGEAFEDYVAERWDEEKQVKRIGDAYQEGIWEEYGEILKGFKMAEYEIVRKHHN